MKKSISFCLVVMTAFTLQAQKPVTWNYRAKKISDRVYELHLKATIQDGWHLYAQQQPENFIGSPTTIKFNNHPLLVFDGKTKEVGELEKKKEVSLDVESWQYNNEVDFVQRVTLKSKAKTNVNGSIGFQVCTNQMCLQPTVVNFTVALD